MVGEYEIKICAIDKILPEVMELDNFPELLDELIVLGDYRRSEVLIKAGIDNCGAIVLATSNENVNIETAIAARRLNSDMHIVVCSSLQNLNQLLKDRLGNFAALDPVELPAASFAVEGLGEGALDFFQKFRDCDVLNWATSIHQKIGNYRLSRLSILAFS